MELPESPDNSVKLKLYGLFKQASAGPSSESPDGRPSFINPIGQAKFDAWAEYGSMSQDEAMSNYSKLVEELHEEMGTASSGTGAGDEESAAKNSGEICLPKKLTLSDLAYPREAKGLSDLNMTTIITDLTEDGVLTVKLNRPKRGNSFNLNMWNDLKAVFEAVKMDSDVKVVILTGGAEVFSTGMDLSVFGEMEALSKKEKCPGRMRESLTHIIQFLQDCISGPEICPVPVIAAINGNCIGGAVDLVTACDLRYCSSGASFSIKETDLAMVADIGTLQRLPKLIGDMQSRELAYTGREFDGDEAEKLGIVLKSFKSNEEMMDVVTKKAKMIAKKSPLTIRGIKSTLLYTRDNSVKESLSQIKMHNSAFLYSSDLMEAMSATMMKKEPNFRDK